MSPHPRIGVAVMVIKSGKVLLGKRKGSHGEGTWALPGGHLAFGETIEGCARREVLEETGLAIEDVRLGPYTNDFFPEDRKHYITLYVVAHCADGRLEIREPDKCEQWDWFDWERLPRPRFRSLENLRSLPFNPFDALKSPCHGDLPAPKRL